MPARVTDKVFHHVFVLTINMTVGK